MTSSRGPSAPSDGGGAGVELVSSKHLEVIARVGSSLLSSTAGLDDQLQLSLDLATEALGADRGSILIANELQETLELRVSVGLPKGASQVTPIDKGISGWVATNREPVVLHGEVSDPRFKGIDSSLTTSLSLPLQADERIVGVLNITRTKGELFTSDDLNLASSVADMASVAIEKARLYTALEERERRVSELLGAAIGAQERERTRIAADIHDGFLQDLSAVYLKAENARMELQRGDYEKVNQSISECQKFLKDQVERIRQYIFEVRPPSLDEVGLAGTLRDMCERLEDSTGISGSFVDETSGARYSKALETIVYRTAQEALRNIGKHSLAKSFSIKLSSRGRCVVLEITDDGGGFDLSEAELRRRHYGVETMRERVELSGGTFAIKSMPGSGTVVRAEIPTAAELT